MRLQEPKLDDPLLGSNGNFQKRSKFKFVVMLLSCCLGLVLMGKYHSDALSEEAIGVDEEATQGADLLSSGGTSVVYTIWAQRHGAGQHNDKHDGGGGQHYVCDPTLTDMGIKQAKCAAAGKSVTGSVVKALETAVLADEVAFFSSPLARCIETAFTMIKNVKGDAPGGSSVPNLTLLPSWREYTKRFWGRWIAAKAAKPYQYKNLGENYASILGECSAGKSDKLWTRNPIAAKSSRAEIQAGFAPFLKAMMVDDPALREKYEDLSDWGDDEADDRNQNGQENRCCKVKVGDAYEYKFSADKFCHDLTDVKKMRVGPPSETADKNTKCKQIFQNREDKDFAAACCRCTYPDGLKYFYSGSGTCSTCKGKPNTVIKDITVGCDRKSILKTKGAARIKKTKQCSNDCVNNWGGIQGGAAANVGDRVRQAFKGSVFSDNPKIFLSHIGKCKGISLSGCDEHKQLLTFYRSTMQTSFISKENGFQAIVDILTRANFQNKQKAYVATHSQTLQYFMINSFKEVVEAENHESRVYESPVTGKKYKFKIASGTAILGIAEEKPKPAVILQLTIKVTASPSSEYDFLLEMSDAKSFPENHLTPLTVDDDGNCAAV